MLVLVSGLQRCDAVRLNTLPVEQHPPPRADLAHSSHHDYAAV